MNDIFKLTLAQRFRNAIKAFKGKGVGSLTFGIDIKKCHECEYKNRETAFYICDREKCDKCSYPECQHTEDIRHAKNFYQFFEDGSFWESNPENEQIHNKIET